MCKNLKINLLNLNKEELDTWFKTNNKSGYKTREKWIKKNHPNFYVMLNNKYKLNIPFIEKIILYVNNLESKPKCLNVNCNNDVKFLGDYRRGFGKFCSSICSNKSEITNNKKKKTYKTIEYRNKRNERKLKTIKTNLERYGFDNSMKNEEVKNKVKKTNIKKYGVSCVFQNEEIKNKIKKTNIKKYGVDHLSKCEEYQKNLGKKIKKKINSKVKKQLIIRHNLNDGDVDINQDYYIFRNFCKKHNEFKILKNNYFSRYRLKTNICTKCNPISQSSSISELDLKNYIIDDLNLNAEKKIINGCEIDIYVEEKNIGIEYNGLYWHSVTAKNIDVNYHLNKTILCENNNVHLIHVFEDEWLHKRDIIKSIIKTKLGKCENKIYARKTEIREIFDNKLIKNFLNENHIQGFIGSKYKIGLFYNGELVSIMTFGNKRIALGQKVTNNTSFEMLRFCSKINTHVIGGGSKLLNYFIKKYDPKEIISYADRRYSNGNLYEKLGFTLIGVTKPNYWYFKRKELIRYHRFNFRKSNLIKMGYDVNKTENEIMKELDYFKIYDCGNYKFILQL